jgi:5-methylcytosine-specific restriction endonuclease McrA
MRALKTQLVARFGQVCQLRLLEECDPGAGLAIDHVIPLSTNKLNKELRNLVAAKGRKVATQSFGSNNIQNLVFECGRCNGYKKHRFLTREQLKRVLSVHKAV